MEETPSKMEAILAGTETLDPEDWCYGAQKRVQNGSDGLWLRFGTKPGPALMNQIFAFQFNPCVSSCAVILLFGLVGFCCIKPGNFCSQAVTQYAFTEGNVNYEAIMTVPQPSAKTLKDAGDWKSQLTLLNGKATSGGGNTFFANVSLTQLSYKRASGGTSTVAMNSVTQKLKDVECFMPKKEFDDWMAWVTECFTWLYIITQDVWIAFAVYLFFSKYGKIKLGRDTDEPEFTYFAWFAMLFTCGVATGLFYFAVSEPMYYYLNSEGGTGVYDGSTGYYERNRWTFSGVYVNSTSGKSQGIFNTPNQRAQDAMTTTWYHWGLHGWVCYCLLGVLLALLHFRKGMPMTIKTCFYPLIGERIYGFLGDFLDAISVVATTMGVCTSLGLGVMQLNSGLELLNGDQHWMGKGFYNQYNANEWADRMDDLKVYWDSWNEAKKIANPWGQSTAGKVASLEAQNNQQMLLIWIITASATCSVMLGLKNGIKQLALLCLGLGQFVIFYVWMMDDTWFLSNLFIQTLGHYIGTLPTLGFYASAVEQSEVNNPYGEYSSWQFWWTIFYWGWWIAWAPFVGVFLARVGKGRSVREFVFCTLFSACIYNFIFMTILGGAGIKMQMLAEKHGVGTGKKGTANACSATALQVDPNNANNNYITVAYKANVCRAISTRKYSGEKEMFCSTITNLGCSLKADGTRPLFDVMTQYADVAKGMTVILLITITLYFVASSDSGSMVDDMVTANGLTEPCLVQRLFWALTEGAAASALLSIGKYVGSADGGLKALRSASICVGLPYTFLVCFMCVSLYRALQYENGDRKWTQGFKSCILDIGVTFYKCGDSWNASAGEKTKSWNGQKGEFNARKLLSIILGGVCPFVPMNKIQEEISKKKGQAITTFSKFLPVSMTVIFYTWFILQFFDYFPISENAQEWGSIMGNASDTAGNSRYYISNRWGYYHQWANKDSNRAANAMIRWNTNVDTKGQEVPLSVSAADGGDGFTVLSSVGVGERFAQNYRIAVIGWFFFFMFVTYLVALRSEVRLVWKIPGSLMEDFLICNFWPNALNQMMETVSDPEYIGSVDSKKN